MDNDKRVDEWLENHDGDDYCLYCKCSAECDGRGVRGGPDGPIYPPVLRFRLQGGSAG